MRTSTQLKANVDVISEEFGQRSRHADHPLLQKIEANFVEVCKRALTSRYAPSLESEEGFDSQFGKYRVALLKHLKTISVDLYVFLRKTLPEGSDRNEFIILEKDTLALAKHAADFLEKFTLSSALDLNARNSALSALNRSLENHFLREQKVLFPIFLKHAK